MASGRLLTKIDKAFGELVEIGLVEPADVAGLRRAVGRLQPDRDRVRAAGRDVIEPVKPTGIAKSLNIGDPAAGPYALEAVRRTGGWMDDVDDDEIRDGIGLLARTTGIFAETAGGVTVAALRKLRRRRRARPGRGDGHLQHRRGAQDARRGRRPAGPTVTVKPSLRSAREAGLLT